MRPKWFDFDPANVDSNYFCNALPTGTSWAYGTDAEWLQSDMPDGLAHQLIIVTAADETAVAKTMTIVGTDADGRAQSDTVTLPNAGNVETTKYFKTITSATTTAETAGTINIGFPDEFVSQTIPLDHYRETAPSINLNLTGTMTFSIDLTNDDPFAWADSNSPAAQQLADQEAVTWIEDTNLNSLTADTVDAIDPWPVRAIRFRCESYTDTAEIQMNLVHTGT